MKRNDAILLCIILTVSIVGFGILFAVLSDMGNTAVVTVDGEEYARLPLDEDNQLLIETEFGSNLLIISDGKAYISEADCPDKTCVKTGTATELKSIVCLPHKLTITIEGGK